MKADDIKIAVIGLGYVGLPAAVAIGKQRPVIAFDINASRLSELRCGYDRTEEVNLEELQQAKLTLTNDPNDLRQASVHIIAVPTPINQAKQPDQESRDSHTCIVTPPCWWRSQSP